MNWRKWLSKGFFGLGMICSVQVWAEAAKFRVTGAVPDADGKHLNVSLAYEMDGNARDAAGQEVTFRLHTSMPNYANGNKSGQEVGKLKFQKGTGSAQLKIDMDATGIHSEQDLVLVGIWPSSHRWGMDDGGRKGGAFKAPAIPNRPRPTGPTATPASASPAQPTAPAVAANARPGATLPPATKPATAKPATVRPATVKPATAKPPPAKPVSAPAAAASRRRAAPAPHNPGQP